jgi:hypothetical protein
VSVIYVSGPMTGIENFNYPAFHDARDRLKAAGHEVLSPADLPIREDWEWVDYMLVDIDAVFACDGVATLDGCDASRGSRIECRIAEKRGVPVRPLAEWLAAA